MNKEKEKKAIERLKLFEPNDGYYLAYSGGKDSIAIVTGYRGKAKGKIGCWIVCTERDDNYHIIDVKTAKVDGINVKEDTFYRLENGIFVEVEET